MKSFAYGIGAGIGAVLFGIVISIKAVALLWPASLPPPALTPHLSLDLKLRYLRLHPDIDPQVLAIGSSIAWRQFDGAAFQQLRLRSNQIFNGAVGYLKVHQSRDLLEFYLARFANVSTVLFMLGPPDFDDCTGEPARMFDHADAAAFTFDRWPTLYFYLRYFAPARYIRGLSTLEDAQQRFTGGLRIDRYGSSPLLVPVSQRRGFRYGAIGFDPACVNALVETSRFLASRGKHLVIVFPPANPDYRTAFPAVTAQLRQITDEIVRATSKDRTTVLDLYDHPGFAAAEFFDAVHLEWPAAKRLSGIISAAMQKGVAGVPPRRPAPGVRPAAAAQ
jgi:hypothetical protein